MDGVDRVGRLDAAGGRWLGVLGGMGPAATNDFMMRLASATPAARDQDHYRTLVYSDPTTPDRSDAIIGVGPSPLRKLVSGVRFLSEAGVTAIALPCNSAHAWYDELQAETFVPILHIADAAIKAVTASCPDADRVGVLGTEGTLRLGFYQDRLEQAGLRPCLPQGPEAIARVMRAIRCVKAGAVGDASQLLREAIRDLEQRGSQAIVIACTDLSVAAKTVLDRGELSIVDASDALARASIEVLCAPVEVQR